MAGKALRFDDKVVLVTGAGAGLGRSHALLFASRGAKVVVNDLGGSATGDGKSSAAADQVVDEIKAAGGEAVANYDSVEDGAKLVQTAMDTWGRIDVVVNNAGILRDTSFAKMTEQDWELIYRVHVLGAFRVTHAAWPHMREQQYGRIIMTASAAGIYGNFGQANYAMAKLGLTGFANTLALEGARRGIHANTIAPIAGSRLTETILPKEICDALQPELVSPLVAWLCHESCEENGGLFEVGGGFYGKLRWERAAGKMIRLGRTVTPDMVKAGWDQITGFDETVHPATVTESMMPILDNVNAGPSRGGNEFIDCDEAVGYEYPEAVSSYDERDLAVYALGVGAANNPLDDAELSTVYEMHTQGMRALPTFAATPIITNIVDQVKSGSMAPGLHFGIDRLLHGEQYTKLERPLPPKATLTHKARITDIWDKGKGAVIVTETKSYDEDGDLLATNEFKAFIRGVGGWGGDRGPSGGGVEIPTREPDRVIEEAIPENQALLYRLSGDINPLHADPNFAKFAGFDRPILHGMCTYGYAARHVIKAYANNDPRYFKSIRARFTNVVFPGETLVTRMWTTDAGIVFECNVKERDGQNVMSAALVELYDEIPKKKPKAKKAAATEAKAAVSAEPITADVFTAMGQYIAGQDGIVGRIGTIYQFKLTDPGSVWTIDLKNGSGSVGAGETAKPQCTLELSDSNFMAMCRGEADPQKMFFDGRLKVSGDIMASQKLDFLKKIDPASVMAAAKKRTGGVGTVGAEAAPSGPTSAVIFAGIDAWLGKHGEVAEQVNTVYLFELSDPDSAWTLDLTQRPGRALPGKHGKPECTLKLTDANFMAMVGGEADPQKMFFDGRLKVSGNIMASQKLDFLQKIDPAEAEAAMGDGGHGDAAAAAAAAASTPSRDPFAPALFAKLAENAAAAEALGGSAVFRVSDLDQAWRVEAGAVSEANGATDVDAVLTLDDETLEALVTGEASAFALYQHGKLRVDGNMDLARNLGFLAKL